MACTEVKVMFDVITKDGRRYTVYHVRTAPNRMYVDTYFLVYGDANGWYWMDSSNCTPCKKERE